MSNATETPVMIQKLKAIEQMRQTLMHLNTAIRDCNKSVDASAFICLKRDMAEFEKLYRLPDEPKGTHASQIKSGRPETICIEGTTVGETTFKTEE